MVQNGQESFFGYDELFYSQTDKKGIILSGNSVFQRVSGYEWNELIGQPHNRIRHPDMPRGVFHLLWEYLKANRPLGAFVKNKSKDGKYYWVFALALPVEDGYISVRMKPGGELLETISKEYDVLRQIELSKKISPQESQQLLLERLVELGFPTYSNFMAVALTNQIEHSCRIQQKSVSTAVEAMERLRFQCLEIVKQTDLIMSSYQKSKFVPLNLEVNAARLGQEGVQISVVANQYQKMVSDINLETSRFVTMSKQVADRIEKGQFYVGASQLLEDVEKYLSQDSQKSEDSKGDNKILRNLFENYMNDSQQGIQEIRKVIGSFISSCESLRSIGSGLELVRITGKIESARLENTLEVDNLLVDLKNFQVSLSNGLKQIVDRSHSIKFSSVELMDQFDKKNS